MNKKGVELAANSIVIIILAIIVLAVLAVGFATGWGKMWDKLSSMGGTDEGGVADACRISCEKQNKVDFCNPANTDKTCIELGVSCSTITSCAAPAA